MKCLVIGATGQTGQTFLEQALATGVEVTAFVRSPDKIGATHKLLTVIEGDALNPEAVLSVLKKEKFDALLIAVGGGLKNDHTNENITKNVIAAANKTKQSPHCWILSACGTGSSGDQLGFFGKVLKATMLRGPFADHEMQEKAIRESGLPCTIVRPVGLTNGPLTVTDYVAKETGKMPKNQISRADVAHYILQHLTDKSVVGKAVALSDKG